MELDDDGGEEAGEKTYKKDSCSRETIGKIVT